MMFFLGVLTVIILFILWFGIYFQSQFGVVFGGLFLLLILFIGWGVVGLTYAHRYEYKNPVRKVEVYKNSDCVILSYNGYTKVFTDVRSYHMISDSSVFLIKVGYNMYGSQVSEEVIYEDGK